MASGRIGPNGDQVWDSKVFAVLKFGKFGSW